MIRKLPRWVEIGGFILTFIAGSVNAVGLLGFQHEAVSHLTGTASLLAMQVARFDSSSSIHLLLVIVSFLLGAIFSGFVIGNTALKLGRRYSVALITEAIFLLIAMYLLMEGDSSGHFFASAACGLQNAMTSSFSGAVVRTTHVSGLFTDIGIMLGAMLHGEPADRRRMSLYLILICGFILGGVAGSLLFFRMEFLSLLLPATLAAMLAMAHIIYRRRAISPA
ncbi:MAG: YoaK family protein [Pseudohongiella sp.]|nr:YoaK family protein [Pseudohongiella sp.]